MTENRRRTERLSRLLSLILRHRPDAFGLSLDPHGWVSVHDLLAAVRRQREWHDASEQDLEAVVRLPGRQRFELRDGRIRALYGHSVPVQPEGTPCLPPEWLYYPISPDQLASVLSHGLRPGPRQFVHLSVTPLQAREIGQRHNAQPVVLTILSRRAFEAGVAFYRASPHVYLAAYVPPAFLLAPGAPTTHEPARSAPR